MNEQLTLPLLEAVDQNNVPRVRALLKQGANPAAQGEHSKALHSASYWGYTSIVELLLRYGAHPNEADQTGLYPLHLAASEGRTAACNRLLKAGAKKEQRNESGGTALHLAAAGNYAATCNALLKGGCDLEARSSDGSTPLLTASALGNKGAVKALLKAGARRDAQNEQEQTALLLALWNVQTSRLNDWEYEFQEDGENARYYLEQGALRYQANYNKFAPELGQLLSLRVQRELALTPWGPTMHLNYLDALATTKLLIQAGGPFEQADTRGLTPLRLACYAGVGQLIVLLEQAGVQPEVNPWQGVTELHQVAASQRLDGLEAYFKAYGNAKVNAIDERGWTPAHYLADMGGPVAMATVLRAQEANFGLKSTAATENLPTGLTPARLAFHWKDLDLAMALDETV
ncbi:MAG: ankyrin repeat domain-containing protein [Aureispira sp.]